MEYLHEILISQLAGLTLFTYGVAVVFCLLEQKFPHTRYYGPLQHRGHRWNRWLRNAGCYAFALAFIPLLEAVPVLIFSHVLAFETSPLASNPAYMLLGVLMLDFGIYISHRLSHRVPVLWAFHKVHHMDEFLDISSAFRFHLFEILQTIIFRTLVIALMGLNTTTVMIYLYLNAVVLIYQHTNIRTPPALERLIGWVFVTPGIHWIHHHTTLPETNSNYCVIFSFWDKLFFTRSCTPRTASTQVGLDNFQDQSWWRLMLFPFIARRTSNQAD